MVWLPLAKYIRRKKEPTTTTSPYKISVSSGGSSSVPTSLGGTMETHPFPISGGGTGGGGGGGGMITPSEPPPPTITVSGGTVFVNGVGYSVAPQYQAEFIRQQGGTVTSSIQSKINASIRVEQQRLAQIQADIQARRIQPRGTIQRGLEPRGLFEIYAPGTIYQYQTESFIRKGKEIPVYRTFTVSKDWTSMEATPEETEQLRTYISAKEYESTALSPTPGFLKRTYTETKGKIEEFGAKPFYDVEAVEKYFSKFGTPGKITGGITTGIIPPTKGGVIKTGVIMGATAGVGFAFKGATTGLSAIPKAGKYITPTFKAGAYGVGAYGVGAYSLTKGEEFYTAEDTFAKSQVIGTGARELGAGFWGFGKGSKAFDITKGLVRTRGRSFIELPQGEYPTAPSSKQLGMFKESVVPELGKEPGAFHTTPETFWKRGILEPKPGTSELPGVYGSTQISTPFSRIPGSISKGKLFPGTKDILSLEGKPGVAFLKPKRFRTPKIAYTSKPTFEGQKSIGGKYAFFKSKPKEGVAEVSGIKAEIEAVFRPEAGKYGLESDKYYTKIKGVRVPVDTFKPSRGMETPRTYKPLDYPSYKPPAKIDITSGVSYSRGGKITSPLRYSKTSSIKSPVSSTKSFISSKKSLSSIGKTLRSSKISPKISSPTSRSFQRSLGITPTFKPTSGISRSKIKTPVIVPFPLKDFGGRKSLFKRTYRRGKPPKRKPSLFAIGRGITAPTIAKGEMSGIVVRPIIVKRRKKKVGKKKKR